MLFNPTREQVREFFVTAWNKQRRHDVLSALESVASGIVLEHPEYHALLESPDILTREFPPEEGGTNPFLHLSLHLAIEEQLTIDHPPGIRAAFDALRRKHADRHRALHDMLECLGQTLYRALRDNSSPDSHTYLDLVRHRAGLPPIGD
ncbi:MAG: DUF1841 family protein [Azoarcus sp.]|jgi:hypothetical protein|nr:DUF1841 family protein [Azoarcus sp.]